MTTIVVSGAKLKCSQGTALSTLTIAPGKKTDAHDAPMATVMDFVPIMNVAPFGMCRTPANPVVAAATAAAQGVLTPQPCVPLTTGPWSPGAGKVKMGEIAALTTDSKCNCAWTGNIEITASDVGDVEVL